MPITRSKKSAVNSKSTSVIETGEGFVSPYLAGIFAAYLAILSPSL